MSDPAKLYAGDEIPENSWPEATILYDIWDSKRGGRPAPSRADLSPFDMKKVLPLITLSDVEWEPFRLKSRLVGTGFVEAIGFDPTGHYTDEFEHTEMLHRRSRWVADHCMPLMTRGLPLLWSPKDFKCYDTLCLPLIGEDGRVNMLLFINRFHVE
nr:PAS domain-containing protein [Kordiimonas marina]